MLNRRLATAKQTKGSQEVIRKTHNGPWLRLRLRAMTDKKTTELDGCAVSLAATPDSLMETHARLIGEEKNRKLIG